MLSSRHFAADWALSNSKSKCISIKVKWNLKTMRMQAPYNSRHWQRAVRRTTSAWNAWILSKQCQLICIAFSIFISVLQRSLHYLANAFEFISFIFLRSKKYNGVLRRMATLVAALLQAFMVSKMWRRWNTISGFWEKCN